MIRLQSKPGLFFILCFFIFGIIITSLFVTKNDGTVPSQNTLTSISKNQLEKLLHLLKSQNDSIPTPHICSNLEQVPEQRSTSHVMLNSYMRSGSSFLGRILGYREDVFYYYEPLWNDNVWTYHKGRNQMCFTIQPRCIDRPQELQTSRRILKDVYSCHIQNIVTYTKFTAHVHANVDLAGTKWEPFNTCKKMSNSRIGYCALKMEEICRNHTNIVSKVLRLDLNLADIILQDLPKLKIVHLFRDPRGSINSHVFTKWFPIELNKPNGIDMDAKLLCERYNVDIDAAVRLQDKYPQRLRAIQYEDFYNLEDKVRRLYNLVGLTSDDKYINSVLELPSEKNRPVYNTTETNVNKLFAYRSTLPWSVVEMVEKRCAEVITKLGLKLYGNEQNYNDPTFSPINGKLKFGL